MKNFFKFTLASIVGFLVAGFILFFVGIGIIGSIISSSKSEINVISKHTVLEIDLSGGLIDRATDNPLNKLDIQSLQVQNKQGLNVILSDIKKAKEDEKIDGIYINASNVQGGIASLKEIRDALKDFKTSGKFILAYADVYSQGAYYLSSIANKIYMNPQGILEFKGLSAQIMFYKDALDKIGVEPIVIRGKNNKFKSAVEPYMYNHMSDANKEQTQKFMSSIWNHLLSEISETRKIPVERLNILADSMKINSPKSAVAYKLIDQLKYYDEILNELKDLTKTKKIKFVSINKYKQTAPLEPKKLIRNKIAVIYASGQIDMGEGNAQTIGSEGLSKSIRIARLDSNIKAIVLRVNSPGGSALASEVIWREMILAKKTKPVIVSMGDVAASGGYYISAPADKIFASPVTITGSIGVFGILMNSKKLIEKLGLSTDVVNTNQHSDIGNIYRAMSEEEYSVIQNGVEDIYDTFLQHVAEGRKKKKEDIDAIGQGRVWSGKSAIEIGLIDEFGGLNKAIEAAKEMAKLTEYRIVEYPKEKSIFDEILKNMGTNVKASIFKNELGDAYTYYQKINQLSKIKGIQMRMPYAIDIR